MNKGIAQSRITGSWMFVLKVLVSLLALAWVLYSMRALEWHAVRGSFSQVSLAKAAACFSLVLVLYVTRLLRLRLWIEQVAPRRLPLSQWIDIYLKSVALGSITPARLGDFSRIAMLADTGLEIRTRGKLVLQDKLTDSLYIPLGLFLTAAIVADRFGISSSGLLAAGASAFLLFFIFSFWFGRALGLKALFAGWGITVLGLALFIVSNALLFRAVNIQLPLLDVAAIILTVGIIASLPVSVGGLGLREGSLYNLLGLWGVAAENIAVLLVWEFLLNMVFPLVLYVLWRHFAAKKSGKLVSG